MNKSKTGYILAEEFAELVSGWGFEAPQSGIKEVFDWLDFDRDGRLTFEDLRATAGQDLAPKEALYFRQDVKPGKSVTCKYEGCWENNNFNSKSQYCQLHQKILRNIAMDRFQHAASRANDDQWEALSDAIIKTDFNMTVGSLGFLLFEKIGLTLSLKEKEAIWESFKSKQALEDNPD